MTHRIGAKGQVVIPKPLRDNLGLRPGDEVDFWQEGDHVALKAVRGGRPLRGRFSGRALSDALRRERAADRKRERRG